MTHAHKASRMGAVMVLVMLAVGIAVVVSASYMLTSRAEVGSAFVHRDHLQARQIAETALEAAIYDVGDTPTWRDARAEGVWVDNASVLGGTATISTSFSPAPAFSDGMTDTSFEGTPGSLPTPLLGPPMSGTIGAWTVTRTALIETGATVPDIGIEPSASATDGSNTAFIAFVASIACTGSFSQELTTPAQPNTIYEIAVDVTTNYTIAHRIFEIRVFAGTDLIASSEHASECVLPALLGDITPGIDPGCLLTVQGLTGSTSEYTLIFTTGDPPPPGMLSIELIVESVGVLDKTAFDNIRLRARSNDPLILTSIGRYGNASHMVTAAVTESAVAGMRIREWREP